MSDNGQSLGIPVPNLAELAKRQQGQLTHYLVTVRTQEGEQVLDYLVTDFGVTPTGNLVLLMNGGLVATYVPGRYLDARRADVVPEVVE